MSVLPIVAGKEEGDPKGTQTSVLGVGLLVITNGPHELLHGHGLLVLVQVALGGQPGWRKGEGGREKGEGGMEENEGCDSSGACFDIFPARGIGTENGERIP